MGARDVLLQLDFSGTVAAITSQAPQLRCPSTSPWLQGASPPRNGLAATRSVLSLANKAQDLLQKQRAIEQAEQDRWVGGWMEGWAGLLCAAWESRLQGSVGSSDP